MAGTPIATEAGPVAIEKLKVGDRVLTGTGDNRTEIVSAQWRKISVALDNPAPPRQHPLVDHAALHAVGVHGELSRGRADLD